jgi:hypothetical protein
MGLSAEGRHITTIAQTPAQACGHADHQRTNQKLQTAI